MAFFDLGLTSLVTGGAGILSSMFGADASAKNTEANIAANKAAMLGNHAFNSFEAAAARQFNAEQAGVTRDFASREAGIARGFEADQAAVNRAFQQQMSSTAYQRQAADMRAAGLNPILGIHSGGSSTPSGSMASGHQATAGSASGGAASGSPTNMAQSHTRHALEGLGDAVNKAISSAVQVKLFDKMTEEIANIRQDTARSAAVEKLVGQQEKTELSETARRRAVAAQEENRILRSNLDREEATAILNMPRWLRDVVVQSGYTGKKVGDALEAVPMLGSTARSVRSLLPSRSRTERTTTDTHGHGRSTFEERYTGGY